MNSTFDKDELLNIISKIQYLNSNTNTAGALYVANNDILTENYGMRPLEKGVPKVVMILTDGESNVNKPLTIPNANAIKARGFSVVSVGIGDQISQAELEAMASNKDDVYNAANYEKIFEILEGLLRTTCQQAAKVILERPIEGKVNKNNYRYFKFNLTENIIEDIDRNYTGILNEFSVGLKDVKGSSKLWYSFDDENPKDPADLLSIVEQNTGGNYVEAKNSKRKRSVSSDEKYYQIKRPSGKEILFMSVKGIGETNEFEVYVYNRTIDVISHANTMHININITILFNIICFIIASLIN